MQITSWKKTSGLFIVSLLVSMFAFHGGVPSVSAEPAWFSYPQAITSLGINVVGSHQSLWPTDTLHIGVTFAPPYPVWANVIAYTSYDESDWVSLGSIGIFNNPSMENANPTFTASLLANSLHISSGEWGTSINNLYFILVDVTDSYRSLELQQTLHVQTYSVIFTELGLPQGTQWSVTFNGHTQSPTSSSITFSASAGSYPFSTSATGYVASPASQGTITVVGDTNIAINWFLLGSEEVNLNIFELGLPSSTDWSVTVDSITETKLSFQNIVFCFLAGESSYTFSAASAGYTAEPSPFDVNIKTVTQAGTYVIFVPSSNPSYFTSWSPVKDSYSTSNTGSSTAWSPSGNCYGFASTALLYFMHKSDTTYPCLPLQASEPDSTSRLDLGSFGRGKAILNDAALAIVFHQAYDRNNKIDNSKDPSTSNLQSFNRQSFEGLSSSLGKGIPEVLEMWTHDKAKDTCHVVVAWGIGELQDGRWGIAVYDSNYPESTQFAVYDPSLKAFSYSGPVGLCDTFMTISPADIKAYLNSPLDPLSSLTGKWQGSIAGYTMVIVTTNGNVKVANPLMSYLMGFLDPLYLKDYFTVWGDSQSFVCNIPGSSGIEEGNAQVYAIPSETAVSVNDPYSDQAAIFIARADNESGQLVEYGCLLNTTTMEGSLNYTITPSSYGLSISTGDNALNASVTLFSTTDQCYSVSDAITKQIDAGQNFNLTMPCATGFTLSKAVVGQGYPIPINVTINNAGNNPENVSLTLCANSTTLDSETVSNLPNGTSVSLVCGGNTSNYAYGNYTLSAYCVPNGVNEAANNFTYEGTVTVTIPGDINGDGKVNLVDLVLLANAYGSNPSNVKWNANADIDSNIIVGLTDLVILAMHYGQQIP